MSEATNLDLILGDPKTVTLGGQDYKLPGDLPIPTATKVDDLTGVITKAEEDDQESQQKASDALIALHDLLLPVFRVHQPDLEQIPASAPQLVLLVPMVYGGLTLDQPAGDGDPPTKAKKPAGTRSTKAAATKTRSRSSASSPS